MKTRRTAGELPSKISRRWAKTLISNPRVPFTFCIISCSPRLRIPVTSTFLATRTYFATKTHFRTQTISTASISGVKRKHLAPKQDGVSDFHPEERQERSKDAESASFVGLVAEPIPNSEPLFDEPHSLYARHTCATCPIGVSVVNFGSGKSGAATAKPCCLQRATVSTTRTIKTTRFRTKTATRVKTVVVSVPRVGIAEIHSKRRTLSER